MSRRAGGRTGWTAILAGWATTVAAFAASPQVNTYVPPETQVVLPSPTALMLRTVASLALVLGLLVATAWLLRLRQHWAPAEQHARLKVIDTVALGGSRTLHLVAVGDQVLLLGGGAQVSHLASFTAEQVGYDPEVATPSFDALLARLHWGRERPTEGVGEDTL